MQVCLNSMLDHEKGTYTHWCKKAFKSGGATEAYRIDMYGKKTNSYGEIIKSGGAMAPMAPPVPTPMHIRIMSQDDWTGFHYSYTSLKS